MTHFVIQRLPRLLSTRLTCTVTSMPKLCLLWHQQQRYKGSIAALDNRDIKSIRLKDFADHNIDPYPRFLQPPASAPLTSIKSVLQKWENTLEEGARADQPLTITGRITSRRNASSKLKFYDISQNGHVIQVVVSRSNYEGTDEKFMLANKLLNRGDIVEITGIPGKTDSGQISVFATKELRLLAPCLHDIPKTGLKDNDTRLRNRHVDLLVNRQATNILEKRAEIIKFIRNYLNSRDFLEVETPVLSTQAGGANARPFETEANALNTTMQLRIAPELYLKQLVVGGIDRVFEIGKQFRNEGIDSDHNPEFTTCEFYQAYGNIDTLMVMTENMVSELVHSITGSYIYHSSACGKLDFTPPFRRINIIHELEERLRQPLPNFESSDTQITALLQICHDLNVQVPKPYTISRILDKLICFFIEPDCCQPTFLYGHPLIMSPLAKGTTDETGRHIAERFELFVARKEIVNAYEELNDPQEQRDRFLNQQQDRERGDIEAQLPDNFYCDVLEFGLPPTAGWGMGIDRVVQLLTNAAHIREVLAFPVIRPLPAENIEGHR